jgi:hypothetical protein
MRNEVNGQVKRHSQQLWFCRMLRAHLQSANDQLERLLSADGMSLEVSLNVRCGDFGVVSSCDFAER